MPESEVGFPIPNVKLDEKALTPKLEDLHAQCDIHEEVLLDRQKRGITNDQDAADAADRLKEISEFVKTVEFDRKAATEPFRTAVTEFNSLVKRVSSRAEKVKAAYKVLIAAWQDHQERLARAEQRRLEEEAREKQRLADEAAQAGDDTTAEMMTEQADATFAEAEVIPEVMAPKSTTPSFGRATGSKYWAYEIVDDFEIPREYLMVNESALKMAARMKPRPPQIPGVRWVEKRRITSR